MNSLYIHSQRLIRTWLRPFLVLLLPVIFNACRKTKVDNTYPLTGVQVGGSAGSSVRLFNFYNAQLDVKANNIPLTAFTGSGSVQGNQIGLSLFPSGVWNSGDNGSPVTMPVSLFDKSGQLHIIIKSRGTKGYPGLGNLPLLSVDTVLNNDPLHPKDYYVMGGGYLKVIDRNIVAPSQSDHFKLRIMNFGELKDTLGLVGPVVLTYADGTRVKEMDTIGAGKTSAYIELPYGSYQLKLYVANVSGEPDYTKQLAELPVYPNFSNAGNTPQQDLVTRVRGFKPGGTYTFLVTSNILGYNTDQNGGENPTFYFINSYRVLTEQSAPQNISWARMQAVNAWQDQAVSFRVDGGALAGGLGFGQSGDYNTIVQGAHHVEAVDASGKTLASADVVLYPYDNITAWVFAKDGKPAIVFTNTDLTTTLYESINSYTVDDGTDGSKNTWHFNYALQTRFLNLSDVPYVTFTKDGALLQPSFSGNSTQQWQNDTLAYPQAYINLQAGVPVLYNPFVVYPSDADGNWVMTLNGQTYVEGGGSNKMGLAMSTPLPIRVFQSSPATGVYEGQVPGSLLGNVMPLKDKDFASGTLIYPDGNLRAENGFYTVALIGNVLGGSGSSGKLIVVKHNK